jgi:hypothetical protein
VNHETFAASKSLMLQCGKIRTQSRKRRETAPMSLPEAVQGFFWVDFRQLPSTRVIIHVSLE